LLLQVLDLRLKGIDIASDLAAERIEFGSVGRALDGVGRLSCSLLSTTISCSNRSMAALGLPCFFNA
jgi:hypothetical protein